MLPLEQKCFQELVYKAFKSTKGSGLVDRQQVISRGGGYSLILAFFVCAAQKV